MTPGRASSSPDYFRAACAYWGELVSGQALVRLGLDGKLYYLVLAPLGVAVATFMFGILKSYATYKGQILGGALELGGPVVAFLLVVIFGFVLVPNPMSFAVTVYVHREDVPSEPFTHGRVILALGGDPRAAEVNSKGEAFFIGIPTNFRGQTVGVQLQGTPGYEAAKDSVRLDADGVRLAVHVKSAEFRGYVSDAGNLRPIADAVVSIAGHAARTNGDGYFKLIVPGTEVEDGATLHVIAPGYTTWIDHVFPGSNEITAQLTAVRGYREAP